MTFPASYSPQVPPPRLPTPDKLWCRTLGELALYPSQATDEPLMRAGKPLAILIYLALSPKAHADRDHVAELFWPDVSLTDAHHSLRQTLYRLRQASGGEPLVRLHGTEVRLLPGVRFDCLDGERAADQGEWNHAVELLRGNFLEAYSIPESREFEEWAESQRTRFRDGWARAAAALAREDLQAGRAERALDAAEELAKLRPFDAAPVHLVMTSLAQLGRHATALARFQAHAEFVKTELDEEPAPELRAYAQEIERYLTSRRTFAATMLPFVGRTQEWSALEACWREAEESHGSTVLIEGAAGFARRVCSWS